MTLTTAQIQAQLNTIDWTANGLPNIVVNTNLQLFGRQKFPRIDIENKTIEDTDKDVTIVQTEQRFIIHVYYRITGTASDEESKVGTIEGLVASSLDGFVFGTDRIRIQDFQWDRQTKDRDPVRHIESALTVLVEKTDSVDPNATVGGNITLTVDSTIIPLLSKPTQLEGVVFDEDRIDDGGRIITPYGDTGNVFCEFESTAARDALITSKINAKLSDTVTFTRGTATENITVYFIDINKTAQFDQTERAILHLEIVQ